MQWETYLDKLAAQQLNVLGKCLNTAAAENSNNEFKSNGW